MLYPPRLLRYTCVYTFHPAGSRTPGCVTSSYTACRKKWFSASYPFSYPLAAPEPYVVPEWLHPSHEVARWWTCVIRFEVLMVPRFRIWWSGQLSWWKRICVFAMYHSTFAGHVQSPDTPAPAWSRVIRLGMYST